jgi:hypothetical protein
MARLIGLALVIATVVRELRLAKEERTWHGLLFGNILCDLRPPSFDLKATAGVTRVLLVMGSQQGHSNVVEQNSRTWSNVKQSRRFAADRPEF